MYIDECRQPSNIYFLLFSASIPPSAFLFHVFLFLSPLHLLSVPVNPFLCLRLQLKSPLPVPRAAQSLLLHAPISLFQIQLLLYTQPRDYISKENRKPNMDMISFIIIRAAAAPRTLVSKIFHSSEFSLNSVVR